MQAILRHLLDSPATAQSAAAQKLYVAAVAVAKSAVKAAERYSDPDLLPQMAAAASRAVAPVEGFSAAVSYILDPNLSSACSRITWGTAFG